ncbi:MAG TPA: hypothetical protein VEW26_15675 [Allosphingosinicella sp.]|nr:hypothetical protein [Allosphingosinicella sp.]
MGLFSCGNTRNYLKKYGYGTIALPREGIKPLLMFVKKGDRLTPLGPLTSTFLPGTSPVPTANRHQSAAVSGEQSKSIDAAIGLSILGNVIGALAGSALGLDVAYKKASKVQFEFGEVMEETIDITALDQFLSNGSVTGSIGNFVKQALEKDEVYVAVATLDARQISVQATDSSQVGVKVDVPVIQQIVGGKIAVSSGGAGSSKITYASNTTPLSFGLKVVRLIVDKGKYTTMKTVKPDVGAEAVAAAGGGEAPDVLGPELRFEL